MHKSSEAILDDTDPGHEVDYLLHEIRSSLGFLGMDQIKNWYAQRMIIEVESFLDALECFLVRQNV